MNGLVIQAYFESLRGLIREQKRALELRDDVIAIQEQQIRDLKEILSLLGHPVPNTPEQGQPPTG